MSLEQIVDISKRCTCEQLYIFGPDTSGLLVLRNSVHVGIPLSGQLIQFVGMDTFFFNPEAQSGFKVQSFYEAAFGQKYKQG